MPRSRLKSTQALNASAGAGELSPLVTQFVSEIESGRKPSRERFLEQHPELADQLDQVLMRRRMLRNASEELETDTDDVVLTRLPLGDFRLIRPIGRGGMGVVYEAEQLSLGRIVAVKVLPFASMLDIQQQKRFRNEARAAATLDHPNIVPVYYVGHERGVHFYAMQLIEGQSLAQIIESLRSPEGTLTSRTDTESGKATEQKRLASSNLTSQHSMGSPEFYRTVARLGSQAAEALAHAHDVGIVHRDVKPGNLMIDELGKLWVTDFGLARFDHGDQLTMTGGVIGTFGYMSPEQAAGSRMVDPRSDVYSLGATLHELLAPLQTTPNATTQSIPHATETRELASLRELDHHVPVDLETIVLKATALDPADRYQSAEEMAEDLRRFSVGANIEARRLTLIERSVRAMIRHRFAVGVTAAVGVFLSVVASAAVYTWSAQISHYADNVEQALVEKQRALATAELAQAVSEEQRRIAETSLIRAESSELRARRMSYRSNMQLAYDRWKQNDWNGATRYLSRHRTAPGENEIRGAEWYLLNNDLAEKSTVLGSHRGAATECSLFPDGRTAATVGEDGKVNVWDLTSKRQINSFDPGLGQLHALAVSPDGRLIAVGGTPTESMNDQSGVVLLDAQTGEEQSRLHKHATTIESIVFSPDGSLIASGARYEHVKVSGHNGANVVTLPAVRRNRCLAYSPSGDRLLGLLSKHKFEIWNPITGAAEELQHDDTPRSVFEFVWSHDERYIVATMSGSPTIALLQVGQPRITFLDPPHPLPKMQNCVAVSVDGYHAVAGDIDGRLHRWTTEPGSDDSAAEAAGQADRWAELPPMSFAVHDTTVTSIRLNSSGQIISTSADGHVCITEPGNAVEKKYKLRSGVNAITRHRDGRILVGSSDGRLESCDPATGKSEFIANLASSGIAALSHSSESRRLAVGYDSGRVDCVDLGTQEVIWTPIREQADARNHRVAISPDGNLIASTARNDRFQLWDIGRRVQVIDQELTRSGYCVSFSPDSQRVVCGSDGLFVFDAQTGEQVLHAEGGSGCYAAQFSPDGKTVATGNWSRDVRLIEIDTGVARLLRGHTSEVEGVGFSTDGKSLFSLGRGNLNSTIRIWDVESGEQLGTIPNPLPVYESRANDQVLAVTEKAIIASHLRGPTPSIHVWRVSDDSTSK